MRRSADGIYERMAHFLSAQTILITGGAGFIGSNLVRRVLATTPHRVVVLDALTYAGNLDNLADVDRDRVVMIHGSITDAERVLRVVDEQQVRGIINCAAETHVDRSITAAAPFVTTNVHGTLVLLEVARARDLRFLQMSTDEVYGDIAADGAPVDESAPMHASSPYSASKAGADLLVQAFVRTHGVNAVITRCSNNYGPYQFPEKFLPVMILNALDAKPLPIYGDGMQVRDWIHVDDHCAAVMLAYAHGRAGAVYNVGADNERRNLDVAKSILDAVGRGHDLLHPVADRPGHDRRYAIDASLIRRELGWAPSHTWEQALPETIDWYRTHSTWIERVRTGAYRTHTTL